MMQFANPPTFLPSSEYRRLQRLMLTMIGRRTALASILRRKLGAAKSARASAAREVATSGMRVHFRVDGQREEERILSWEPPEHGDTVHLSLLSPRGLALLGLAPGETIAYRIGSGRTEFLEVGKVFAAEPRRSSPTSATSPLRDIVDAASAHFTTPDGAVSGG